MIFIAMAHCIILIVTVHNDWVSRVNSVLVFQNNLSRLFRNKYLLAHIVIAEAPHPKMAM